MGNEKQSNRDFYNVIHKVAALRGANTVGVRYSERVKATPRACGEHSMTYLARYPVIGYHSADDFAFLFKDKINDVWKFYCFDAHLRCSIQPHQRWKIGLL